MGRPSLPLQLEQYFQQYEEQLFKGGPPVDYASWEGESYKYFDRWHSDAGRVDALFNRFANTWGILYQIGEFAAADAFWEMPIEFAHRWEQATNKILHKGTPYYFRAMAAVMNGGTDRGFVFFHQALKEDRRSWGPTADTPSWKFVTLDADNPRQAAYQIVKSRADWLTDCFVRYGASIRGSMTLSSFRSRALDQARLMEATFSFTHTVFRSENLTSMPDEFLDNEFASQIELDTLFSFARIAEVWLKDRQQPSSRHERQLGGQLIRFFAAQSWTLSHDPDIKAINAAGFDNALTALLDGNRGRLSRAYAPTESDLLIIYVLRNQAGHAPTSSGVVRSRFPEILDRVLFGLITIVDRLF